MPDWKCEFCAGEFQLCWPQTGFFFLLFYIFYVSNMEKKLKTWLYTHANTWKIKLFSLCYTDCMLTVTMLSLWSSSRERGNLELDLHGFTLLEALYINSRWLSSGTLYLALCFSKRLDNSFRYFWWTWSTSSSEGLCFFCTGIGFPTGKEAQVLGGVSLNTAHPSTELRSASPGWTGQYGQLFPGAWEIAQPRRDGGSDPDQALGLQDHTGPCLSLRIYKVG